MWTEETARYLLSVVKKAEDALRKLLDMICDNLSPLKCLEAQLYALNIHIMILELADRIKHYLSQYHHTEEVRGDE